MTSRSGRRTASGFDIAGVDVALHPNVNLIPNVEIVDYDDAESDIVPRVTFYFRF
ncbi:MAG TPA: hypothetical protein VIL97_00835 [Thermoanaerobaculia bacterium]